MGSKVFMDDTGETRDDSHGGRWIEREENWERGAEFPRDLATIFFTYEYTPPEDTAYIRYLGAKLYSPTLTSLQLRRDGAGQGTKRKMENVGFLTGSLVSFMILILRGRKYNSSQRETTSTYTRVLALDSH